MLTTACYLALTLVAAEPTFHDYRLPLMAAAPTLDGQIDEAAWAGAMRFAGLVWAGRLERRRATAWVGATADTIYLALQSQLPDDGPLLAEVDRDSTRLVYDDAVEFWIDPNPGAPNGATYQLLANSLGHRSWQKHSRGAEAADAVWQGDWQVSMAVANGWWAVEVAVPIASLAAERTAGDGAWAINICRDWKPDWAWSGLAGAAYAPSCRFTFDPTVPLAGQTQRGDEVDGRLNPAVSLRNSSAAPQTVDVDLSLWRDHMPPLHETQTVAIAPGGTELVGIDVVDVVSRRAELTATITDSAGRQLFWRQAAWDNEAPKPWVTARVEKPPVDFRYAYYPYANRLRAEVDLTNLAPEAQPERAWLSVRRPGGEAVRRLAVEVKPGGRVEQAFDLPELDGQYELALTVEGPGVPAGEVVKPLERKRYEWEHTALGRGHEVYAPFEPLTWDAPTRRLHSVLRDHTLGEAGLWEQVFADGAPLLAGPVRLVATPAGGTATPLTGSAKADETRPDHIVLGGALAADRVALGSWRGGFDLDGALRYDLTLDAAAGRTLDQLDLVIPLRDDASPLIHAMGDGIRNTVYAKVPAGDGPVWDASQVRCEDLPKGFCSYIYVGGPHRGLAWFAENDSGWGWDRATPNLDLSRRDGVLTLTVHLINQPTALETARHITFGLQAAPVKPRLGDWRYRWQRDNYSLLGTDINWLALGDCGSVYPAGRDLSLWEAIRRGNTEHLSDADIEEVVQRSLPYNEPYGPERVDAWIRHVRYNLRGRYGTKMVYYYNRASYQAAEEWQTFGDEWSLTDWRTVGPGNGISEIKIVPSESYIDHALYWYDQSIRLGGNQGVYWDNWFFVGDYNTQMSAAYRTPDGAVQPSTGVWGLRELARRTFQMMGETGRLPITMAHMTSTSILPLLGFCTVQYDWEWKYSEGDVQDRYPREYLLLVSNGELAGTWPVLLADQGALAQDPWTQRTFAGVCLLHELDGHVIDSVRQALYQPVWKLLDDPSCQVWRYWDERPQPVRAASADQPCIVYAVPGRQALVAVVGYVDGDSRCDLSVDAAALGLDGDWRAVDAESGAVVPRQDNGLSFDLPRHAVRLLRLEPTP